MSECLKEKQLKQVASKIRRNIIEMAHDAGKEGSHLGGALSSVEILVVLYMYASNLCNENGDFDLRDKILISKGHCVLAYYNILHECGFLSDEDLAHYEKNGFDMPGHPLRNYDKRIEYSTGSLGMALSVGVGMALSAKIKQRSNRVFVLLGDGECEEGSIWEAALCASHNKLDNLVAIIDRNHLQYDGSPEELAGMDDVEGKFKAFGWDAVSVDDGHEVGQLITAFDKKHSGAPLAIIANTVKGKGVSFMENDAKWHHGTMTEKEYLIAISEQG